MSSDPSDTEVAVVPAEAKRGSADVSDEPCDTYAVTVDLTTSGGLRDQKFDARRVIKS